MEKSRKCTRYKGELGVGGSLRQKRKNRRKGNLPVWKTADGCRLVYTEVSRTKRTGGNMWNSEHDIENKEMGHEDWKSTTGDVKEGEKLDLRAQNI